MQALANGSVPAIGTERSWVNQEMRKEPRSTVSAANALPNSTVQTNSFFGHFDDAALYDTNGGAVAQQPAMHRQLLADAIPALSNPAGRNSIDSAAGQGNRDMMFFRRGVYANGDWPDDDNRWHHSDLKRVAYPYNSNAFDQMVNDGSLQ